MPSSDENDREPPVVREGRAPAPSRDGVPDDVGAASAESFPASDPPSWTGLHAGPPDRATPDGGAP